MFRRTAMVGYKLTHQHGTRGLAVAVATATLTLSGCGNRDATSRNVYSLSSKDLGIDLPYRQHSGGRFSYTIIRDGKTAEERRLLRIAEAVYPDHRAVLELVAEYPPNSRPSFDDEDRHLWWCAAFDDVRIPFAITAAAVQYYIDTIEELRLRKEFAPRDPRQVPHAEFIYGAWLERHDQYEIEGSRFKDVWVVNMRLRWDFYCGGLCGLWFNKERTVVLGPGGEVLFIAGDGKTSHRVS